MKARLPKINYSEVRADWAPTPEFAHQVNASSTGPSFVEPWLIKVMSAAKAILPAHHIDLHEQIAIFIAQEAQHFRQHNGFNKRIREQYPKIIPHEQRLKHEYDEMFANRPLKFCLAYAEGFESIGPIAARMWFEDYSSYLEGADYEAVALWKWHMAEEYEHREVCFRLFKTLYAQTFWTKFWNGWLYRIYGFYSAVTHLGGYTKNVYRELIEADRERMTVAEQKRSKERERKFLKFMKRKSIPAMLRVISPFYNPQHLREPKGMADYLVRFERGGDMGAMKPVLEALNA